MNLIWIIADTVRCKDLGYYGNKKIKTPTVDAFGAKSVGFMRHYIASFPTMPARADFLTGRWTGCFMEWAPFPEGQLTLPTLLRETGYNTAAVVDTPFYLRQNLSQHYVGEGMNYDQGFNTFIEIPGQWSLYYSFEGEGRNWHHESEHFAPRTFNAAGEWLERHCKEKFFLYIDTWDPHEPYDAPDYYTKLYYPEYDGEIIDPVYMPWQKVPGFTEEKLNKAYATYCGKLTMVDTWLGYFLKKVENMGLMDDTAIIFVTDHGFYFGEHGGIFGKEVMATVTTKISEMRWSGSPLYEEVTRIPLTVYMPGARPGKCDGLTSAIDLMPTVLDILGVKIPDWVEGQSLLPLVNNNRAKGRDFVISGHPFTVAPDKNGVIAGRPPYQSPGWDTTITTEEWALLYSLKDPCELYHLPSDPDQKRNVIKQHPEVAKKLHSKFVKFLKEKNVAKELVEPRLTLEL
jgi:arylsulfatase A-like enzyme